MTSNEFRLFSHMFRMLVLTAFILVCLTSCKKDSQIVSVYKSDGSLQCQVDNLGIPPTTMQVELMDHDIQIHNAYKTHDGLMHIQLCGTPTDNINVFEISVVDIEKAQTLGFVLMVEGDDE